MSAVYEKFKMRYPSPNTLKLMDPLNELLGLSSVYARLLNPQLEKVAAISRELGYITLAVLQMRKAFVPPRGNTCMV